MTDYRQKRAEKGRKRAKRKKDPSRKPGSKNGARKRASGEQ